MFCNVFEKKKIHHSPLHSILLRLPGLIFLRLSSEGAGNRFPTTTLAYTHASQSFLIVFSCIFVNFWPRLHVINFTNIFLYISLTTAIISVLQLFLLIYLLFRWNWNKAILFTERFGQLLWLCKATWRQARVQILRLHLPRRWM